MAAKQMHLLLYFDITRKFIHNENYYLQEENSNLIFSIFSDSYSFEGFNSFSRMLGKKLVRCDRIEMSRIWPFEVEKVYLDFIIGGDVDRPKKYTCNPEVLSNYFGANKKAPNYLTPVFFKKEVMQKYYSSEEYLIGDGRLSRRGSWSLRFDNNAKDHVSVFLGDLGQDLPSKEQEYWKSFNIFADGKKLVEQTSREVSWVIFLTQRILSMNLNIFSVHFKQSGSINISGTYFYLCLLTIVIFLHQFVQC